MREIYSLEKEWRPGASGLGVRMHTACRRQSELSRKSRWNEEGKNIETHNKEIIPWNKFETDFFLCADGEAVWHAWRNKVVVKVWGFCSVSSDIDECAEGLIQCHNHSRCVNLPGWYHCECRSGFHDNGSYLLDGSSCIGKDTPNCTTWFSAPVAFFFPFLSCLTMSPLVNLRPLPPHPWVPLSRSLHQ